MRNLFLVLLATAACTQSPQAPRVDRTYSAPEKSSLVAVRPYPFPDDVCQVIGENDVTIDMLDHSSLLIACPAHERSAIGDRIAEGAERGAHIGAWVLLRVPNDL